MAEHLCNGFCHGTVHCTRVLAAKGWSPGAMRTHYRNKYGWRFLRLIPAREADVTQWRAMKNWSALVESRHTEPWLLFTQVFTS